MKHEKPDWELRFMMTAMVIEGLCIVAIFTMLIYAAVRSM